MSARVATPNALKAAVITNVTDTAVTVTLTAATKDSASSNVSKVHPDENQIFWPGVYMRDGKYIPRETKRLGTEQRKLASPPSIPACSAEMDASRMGNNVTPESSGGQHFEKSKLFCAELAMIGRISSGNSGLSASHKSVFSAQKIS